MMIFEVIGNINMTFYILFKNIRHLIILNKMLSKCIFLHAICIYKYSKWHVKFYIKAIQYK